MNPYILVVDDSVVNLKLATHILEAEGYRVGQAEDAESALEMIRQAPPDLLLLDLQLPEMDGLTLARLLKADEGIRPFPIVALTAHAMKGDAEKAFAAGCDGYITKPIDTRKFPQQIAEHLAKKA
ncbi:MAG: response regulator [Verrucomicrobium sp.]|nr:response regulator [Verrucomicrobium sp.]